MAERVEEEEVHKEEETQKEEKNSHKTMEPRCHKETHNRGLPPPIDLWLGGHKHYLQKLW